MTRIFKLQIILFIFFFNTNLYSYVENKIIVKVDDKIITTLDVEREIKTFLIVNNLEINKKNVVSTKNLSINSLIRKIIKKKEIKKYNIEEYNSVDVENHINNLAKSKNMSLKILKDKFKTNNLNFNDFREDVKSEFLWKSLIFKLYANQIEVNPIEIENEIENQISNKKKLKYYDLSEIEIVNNPEIENNIKKVLSVIKEKGFETAVSMFSISPTKVNNGKLGWVEESQLSEKYLKKISKMKIGNTSEPINSINSVIFLKVNNIKIDNQKNLDVEKLKSEIIRNKKNEKLQLFSNTHFAKIQNSILIEKR